MQPTHDTSNSTTKNAERKEFLPVIAEIPLLDGREMESEDEEECSKDLHHRNHDRKKRRRLSWKFMTSISLHIIMLVSFLGLYTHSKDLQKRLDLCSNGCKTEGSFYSLDEPYTPASEAVEYVLHQFEDSYIFQGEPSEKVDKAWRDLLKTSEGRINVSPDMMNKLQGESIEHPDKPGTHIYGLSAFHQLHCLDRIRKSFYREKYFPHDTDLQFIGHKAHCIDILRQHIMCHGDVQMVPFWNDKYYTTIQKTLPDGRTVSVKQHSDYFKSLNLTERWTHAVGQTSILYKCRNFEKLTKWVQDPSRRIDDAE